MGQLETGPPPLTCAARRHGESSTCPKKRTSRPDVAARKKRQKAEDRTTVKFTVNRIDMCTDLRERVKSDAARLQTISFVGTRFTQFVLLHDLKNGKDRFRPHAGKDGAKE